MAGGTWTTQNKVRPGVYIRFTTNRALGLTVGERGVVTICEPMSWGPVGEVMTVANGDDMTPYTGYDITNEKNRFLREIFRGTNRTSPPTTLYLYRPTATSSAKATVTTGTLTATAKYPGVRGNDITIVVAEDVDNEGSFFVSTVVDGEIQDQQSAETVADLVPNDWVDWSGTGALTATVGAPLTSGADGTVAASAYSDYLEAIEPYKFDVIIYDGSDSTVQDSMVGFVNRLADENGQYTQLVAANLTAPDSRFVINVMSGVTLADGTTLTPQQVTWWAGGATAGAQFNESLTYATYPTAVAVSPLLTNNQIISALQSGQFILVADFDEVHVEQDIDSLTTYTTDIGVVYKKNRIIRLCNTIANDIYKQFSQNYIGVVNNNDAGRARFKAAIVGYLYQIQDAEGIQNFDPEDVEVLPGIDIDAIVVNVAFYAVDSVEKVYMSVSVS
jgi:hypothetical protein